MHFLDSLDCVFSSVHNGLAVSNLTEPFLSRSYLLLKLRVIFAQLFELLIWAFGFLELVDLFGQVQRVGLQGVISQL